MKQKFLKKLTILILICSAIVTVPVLFFDPFFHYHKPIGPLKEVLTKAEYQVIGTLRTFDYNAVIAGSSMAENYSNKDFDTAYGCTTIKAVKPGADTADLVYLLEEAFREQEIEKVFYTLDISAITSSKHHSFAEEGMPEYLYNHNPLDDIQYLMNKDVLFEDIPYMIATSFIGDYKEELSYYWAEGKDFTTMHYEPIEEQQPIERIEDHREDISRNISALTELIRKNPDTEFIIIVPPYSSLWWYENDRNGELELSFYALEEALTALLKEENTEIHYYQHLDEITGNLDLFMDLLHFHPKVNEFIVDTLVSGDYEMNTENKEEYLNSMRKLAEKSINVYAREYFDTKK